MEKKESPNKAERESPSPGSKSKLSGISGKLFSIIKLVLAICLLPFVYSVTKAFLNEFTLVDIVMRGYFWKGIITLLLIYLFVWEPAIIYAKGHQILEVVFTFMKPLVKVAPYLLPIYTLILFVAYPIYAAIVKTEKPIPVFIFLIGFTIALHLIFGAKSLRTKKEDFLKSNYIFGFSFVYILNLALVAFFFSLIFDKFSFVNFCNYSYHTAQGFFTAIFKQLFL